MISMFLTVVFLYNKPPYFLLITVLYLFLLANFFNLYWLIVIIGSFLTDSLELLEDLEKVSEKLVLISELDEKSRTPISYIYTS